MMSQSPSHGALRRKNSSAVMFTTSVCSSGMRHRSRLASMSPHIFRDRSTKVTNEAPLESASIPTAPEPAHKSRNRASVIRGAMTLNSVSRRRSEVGRTCIEGGLFNFRPLYVPAITRIRRFDRITRFRDYKIKKEQKTRSGMAFAAHYPQTLASSFLSPLSLFTLLNLVILKSCPKFYPIFAKPKRGSLITRSIIFFVAGESCLFIR